MAITGLLLFAFVVIHMVGNLQVFMGSEYLNAYADFLQSKPAMVWGARSVLLIILLLHVMTAIQVSAENKSARPVPYAQHDPVVASYASRTMIVSGLVVFVFIIYHLLHFTVCLPSLNFLKGGPEMPNTDFMRLMDEHGRHDVYRMVVLGFSNPWVSGFYILGMALLCQHLSHGLKSMFQSMGWAHRHYSKWIEAFAFYASLIIFIGNTSMPLAVLLDRKFALIHIFS